MTRLTQPEPIAQLSALVKAQLVFHASAAEALSAIQGQIDEASAAAENEYRYVFLIRLTLHLDILHDAPGWDRVMLD